jgi:hypothetical protein
MDPLIFIHDVFIDVKLAPRGASTTKHEILPNVFPWIKVSPFDGESNSETDGLILMDGNSFWREKFSLGHYIYTHICVREKKRIQVKFWPSVFPSIKVSPLDAESNSESKGDTFIHGKTFGKISCFVVLAPRGASFTSICFSFHITTLFR